MSTPISRKDGRLVVPDDPIIPFIEGDGTGPDIWRASVRVFDAAVKKSYGGKRCVAWKEVLAGEKSFKQLKTWLPEKSIQEYLRHGTPATKDDDEFRRVGFDEQNNIVGPDKIATAGDKDDFH